MKTYSILKIGKDTHYRLEKLSVVAHRYAPLTTCLAIMQDPDGRLYEQIAEGTAVDVEMGYRLGLTLQWKGHIRTKEKHEKRLKLYCVGVEQALENKVKQVWLNECPEKIVQQMAEHAGFGIGRIQSTGLTIPRFVVNSRPVWEAERMLCKTLDAFGVDTSKLAFWVGANGMINWGSHDEEGQVEIVSGENMVSYRRNEIEAMLIPNLRSSQRVHVIAPGMDEVKRAVRVIHQIDRVSRTFVLLEDIDG